MSRTGGQKQGEEAAVESEKATVAEAGAKGGKARAAGMSPEDRRLSAEKAAAARWGANLPKATHGSPDKPLNIGGLEIPCYVLEDGRRVLHQRGLVTALGMARGSSGSTGGDRLAKFTGGDRLKAFVSDKLREVTSQPIRFKAANGKTAYGYEATVLADICEAVLAARGAGVLQRQQEHIATRCEILVRGFARVGIIALVDEATGFQADRARDALAKILEAFIAKELRPWVPTFDMDFYTEMFRLRGIKCVDGQAKGPKGPRYIGRLTNDLIYARLAPGVLAELRQKNPVVKNEASGKSHRKAKHHQWLTGSHGHPELKTHIAVIIGLMRASDNWEQFMKMVDRSKPRHIEMPLFDWKETD